MAGCSRGASGAGWEESDGTSRRRRTTPKESPGGAGSNNHRGRCARSRSRAQRRDVRRTAGESRTPLIYTGVQMLEKFSQSLKKVSKSLTRRDCVRSEGSRPAVFWKHQIGSGNVVAGDQTGLADCRRKSLSQFSLLLFTRLRRGFMTLKQIGTAAMPVGTGTGHGRGDACGLVAERSETWTARGDGRGAAGRGVRL